MSKPGLVRQVEREKERERGIPRFGRFVDRASSQKSLRHNHTHTHTSVNGDYYYYYYYIILPVFPFAANVWVWSGWQLMTMISCHTQRRQRWWMVDGGGWWWMVASGSEGERENESCELFHLEPSVGRSVGWEEGTVAHDVSVTVQ